MRSREAILKDGNRVDRLQLELLVDIRELLEKQVKFLKPKRGQKTKSRAEEK